MKPLTIYFLILVSALFITCETQDDNVTVIRVNPALLSLERWKELKQMNGTSYSYDVKTNSFSGFGSITTIIVTNNVITKRTYESYRLFDNDFKPLSFEERIIQETFIETTEELNSNTLGAKTATIDELYKSCINKYLKVDPNKNIITFKIFNTGLMSTCSYFPKDCQDDCTIGVSISNFKWIN